MWIQKQECKVISTPRKIIKDVYVLAENPTCERSSECEGKLICNHGERRCSVDYFWNESDVKHHNL